MLIGRRISSPSKFVILVAPPDMIFLMIKGPNHLDFISNDKSLIFKHLQDQVPFLKVSWFHFLVECSSNHFLVTLCMVLCHSSLLIHQNQLFISCLSLILFQDLSLYQYPQRLYLHLNRKHCLTTINQRVRCFPSQCLDRSSVTSQGKRKFLDPIFVCHYHLGYDILHILIGCFYGPISLHQIW